jgi:DNA invertase Pin-like site-specific DNA recombinase
VTLGVGQEESMPSRFGYARSWALDRDAAAQKLELEAMGCAFVRVETDPAAGEKALKELDAIVSSIDEADTLVVTRARVLGRSTRDVLSVITAIGDRGAFVEILSPPVSTRGREGRTTLEALKMVLEMERSFIKERQREGIEKAKAKGLYKGRPPRIDRETVERLSKAGHTISDTAKKLGCSRGAVYKILAELQADSLSRDLKM